MYAARAMAHALHEGAYIMKTNSLSLTLLLALSTSIAGCAGTTTPGDDDHDVGDNGDDGYDDDDDAPVPLTAEGTYDIASKFDIATNIPGTAGTVINAIIDATDGPDDPTAWILDQLVAQLPDGAAKNTLQGAIPYVAGYLNDRLLEVAPGFVITIRDLGNKFGQLARNFGTLETLEIGANGLATKKVTGVHFVVDELELAFAFKDYGVTDVTVPNVAVDLDKTGRLSIGEHRVPLAYGKVLRIALDEMLIPLINPSAVTLEDVLKGVVNCKSVGIYVYEAIEIGSASTFEQACLTGLKAASNAIYMQIGKIDAVALEFDLTGVAKGVDKDRDGKLDKIQTGTWTGTVSYAGNGAPLASGTFIGSRM